MKIPETCAATIQKLKAEKWRKTKKNQYYIFFGKYQKRLKVAIASGAIIDLPDESKIVPPKDYDD